MKNLVIAIVIIAVLIVGLFVFMHINKQEKNPPEKRLYQGPVPLGYDEQYFRETGMLKKLNEKERE